ncbi:cyclin-dependent kinase inhibitor 1D [Conger conger]|uniref:cyclin-dependent kinase inhibitor 1D n=1 Tax=Conger conger TaxID=82655 RepID=UPI002A5A41B2|nr:cyclin-dependent kinase inhibitor 1D [Conger conger]XP_061107773.1 cyclin-dependent kinase inhibitor 1D [Conger conger]
MASFELDSMQEDMNERLRAGPVRRNLFGPVDHQQLQQDFERLLCMSVEVANKRWNFDFQRDRPGQGSIEWEELRCQDVPAFYRSCVVKAGAGPKARVPGGGAADVSETQEYLEITARETYRSCKAEKRLASSTRKRKQATITEFFCVKKKRSSHHKGPAF